MMRHNIFVHVCYLLCLVTSLNMAEIYGAEKPQNAIKVERINLFLTGGAEFLVSVTGKTNRFSLGNFRFTEADLDRLKNSVKAFDNQGYPIDFSYQLIEAADDNLLQISQKEDKKLNVVFFHPALTTKVSYRILTTKAPKICIEQWLEVDNFTQMKWIAVSQSKKINIRLKEKVTSLHWQDKPVDLQGITQNTASALFRFKKILIPAELKLYVDSSEFVNTRNVAVKTTFGWPAKELPQAAAATVYAYPPDSQVPALVAQTAITSGTKKLTVETGHIVTVKSNKAHKHIIKNVNGILHYQNRRTIQVSDDGNVKVTFKPKTGWKLITDKNNASEWVEAEQTSRMQPLLLDHSADASSIKQLSTTLKSFQPNNQLGNILVWLKKIETNIKTIDVQLHKRHEELKSALFQVAFLSLTERRIQVSAYRDHIAYLRVSRNALIDIYNSDVIGTSNSAADDLQAINVIQEMP